MVLFEVFQEILLPSSFSLLLMVVGVLLWRVFKKRKAGEVLLFLGILIYYLFSITPVSNYLLLPLENKYPLLKAPDSERADKIVLLLGGRETDVLRASEVLRISYLKDGNLKVIISGTDPLLLNSEEAQGVKDFFANRGVKEKNIIIEGKSRNTAESVKNLKDIVGQSPFFLVTSAYHMERAMREFKKIEANPIPAPTDFKVKTEKYTPLDFLPDPRNLRNSNLAIHEYLGILFYQFF